MKYSEYTKKIDGEGAAAWEIHKRAVDMSASGKDVILLSMGDPDFDTPSPIVESAVKHLRSGATHYTGFTGEDTLREVIAQQHCNSTGCATTADNVVILSGAQCALYCAVHCIVDAGDEVIVPEPTYVTYEAVVNATGAKMVPVAMPPEEGFRLDAKRIRDAVTPKTRAIILNSPHNPTGTIIEPDTLRAIAKIAMDNDLWLVSDEVYGSLLFQREHQSIASVPGMAERVIVVNSVSKSHAMTGWRIGWAIGPTELSYHLANMTIAMLYGCPTFSQLATVSALTEQIDELDAMKREYQARRDTVYQCLSHIPGLGCHLPEGGMFMMIDIRKTGLSAEQFASELLDAYGVSVLAGEAFGPSAAGHLRLGLVEPRPVLIEACRRIERCFKHLLAKAA